MHFAKAVLAYCGIYCEQCSGRAANADGDWAHLAGFPEKYKAGRPNLSDYDCEGCKGRNLCGPCAIKDCAAPRGVDSCADCADFPCEVVEAFGNDGVPHHRQALENLRSIRENGVESWFAPMRPALYCPCGKRQSWYHVCPEHG